MEFSGLGAGALEKFEIFKNIRNCNLTFSQNIGAYQNSGSTEMNASSTRLAIANFFSNVLFGKMGELLMRD